MQHLSALRVTLPTPSSVSTSTILAKKNYLESVAFMQRLAEMEAFVLQMLKNDKSIKIIIYHMEGAWWGLDKKGRYFLQNWIIFFHSKVMA